MEIEQKDNGAKGLFFVEIEGKIVAEMVYSWRGQDRIVIEHTEVDESLEGKGVGKLLVKKSVEFAREKDIKIIPICSFAKSIFQKTSAYNDVL